MSKMAASLIAIFGFLWTPQTKAKELPLTYVQDHIHKFLDGQTLYFPPLKSSFKMCYQRIGYSQEKAPSATQVAEANYPLAPKIYEHFTAYQIFSVQRAHEERVDLIGICRLSHDQMMAR